MVFSWQKWRSFQWGLLVTCCIWKFGSFSLNSRDLFLNLRRLVKMTKPLRFENKSLRLKYKCLIWIWIIFWAILDLFINPKYLFQNKSFSQTYYFKSEKSFVILTSLLGLKINPGNLESWVTDDKNYGTFSKEWGPRVKAPQWLGVKKSALGVDHGMWVPRRDRNAFDDSLIYLRKSN